jgi:flagellar basal-body rod protein FlgF
MLRGLYTVSTVLEQHTKALDVMSNNLANTNSHGYKRDIATYEEFHSSLLSKVGGSPAGVVAGTPKVTQNEYRGEYTLQTNLGFFRVDAPGGVSHNTSVRFRVGEDGFLKTIYYNSNHRIIKDAGHNVLGANGPIQIGDQPFEVTEQGDVIVGGQVVDSLIYRQGKGVIGTMSGGIKFNRIVTDFEQSDLQNTENLLDFALVGSGFFAVETPLGERYTRSGNFKINGEYELVTSEGFNVIGIDGPIVLEGYEGTNLNVNKYGELSMDGIIVDKFKLVNPMNTERLKKAGGTVFRFDGEMEEEPFEGEIVQGFLEGSNVNTLKEMIQIMEVYRLYESAQRVVRSYDDTLAKAVNDVARL